MRKAILAQSIDAMTRTVDVGDVFIRGRPLGEKRLTDSAGNDQEIEEEKHGKDEREKNLPPKMHGRDKQQNSKDQISTS